MTSLSLSWPALVAGAFALLLAGIGATMGLQWLLVGRRSAPPNARRNLTNALWGPPSDSYIHTTIQVPVDDALRYLEELTARTGTSVTLTHLVAKALGRVLHQVPDFNRTLVWNRFIEHDTHELSFLVALDKGRDTGWVKVDVDESKTVTAIAEELRDRGLRMRGPRGEKAESGGAMARLPRFIFRPLVNLASFVTAGLGIPLRAVGMDAYPFGRIVVINSSAFGVETAYVSRTAFARVSMNVLICKVIPTPVVVDGQIVVRQCVNLCVNADHRYVDGLQLGRACSVVKKILKNPWSLDETAA